MVKALDDVRVIDLTHFYNGPYSTLVLGFLGAEVIKVEPPRRGERARTIFPIPDASRESFPFVMLNSNKNLKAPRGQELFKELVTQADVVVENFAVGVMDRLGLGYEVLQRLNSRLVYASSTGYGQTGPYSSYPAFDPIIQAMAGIMSTTGFPDGPPLKAGPPIMDILGGIHLAAGILAALHQRSRTGEGVFLETSLYDAAMGPLVTQISSYLAKGGTFTRSGNTPPDRAFSPYNCYPTKDGYVLLLTADDRRWRSLCQLMGREELAQDPRFATNAARRQRAEEVDAIVSQWTTQQAKQEVMEQCGEADITCGVVKEVSELLTDPHIRARGMLQDIEHPTVGKMAVLGSPWRFDGEHPPIDSPSPTLGQHNELVYEKLLGPSTAEIAELKEQGVI
jgi:CoA:oxalate CoA-transferase